MKVSVLKFTYLLSLLQVSSVFIFYIFYVWKYLGAFLTDRILQILPGQSQDMHIPGEIHPENKTQNVTRTYIYICVCVCVCVCV